MSHTKWKVEETLRDVTREPEGEYYNTMITKLHGKVFLVSGPPFCFAGYDPVAIKRKCIRMIDAHLEGDL